jgi:hypothetical protein
MISETAVSVKYWEIIADNLKKAGFSFGWRLALDYEERTIWIADEHRDGRPHLVRADEKLSAFLELEAAIRLRTAKIISRLQKNAHV